MSETKLLTYMEAPVVTSVDERVYIMPLRYSTASDLGWAPATDVTVTTTTTTATTTSTSPMAITAVDEALKAPYLSKVRASLSAPTPLLKAGWSRLSPLPLYGVEVEEESEPDPPFIPLGTGPMEWD